MESLHCNTSGRSEDFEEDDAYPLKHYPHEHTFSSVADLFGPTRNHHEHTHSRFFHPTSLNSGDSLVFMSLLIPVYEFAFVPILSKITGHPNGITHWVGLVLSALSMTIAGIIEVKRKYESIQHNYQISLFWLSFHYASFGIADMFTLVGLMEFFYKEAPTGMRSLSTSFSWLSLSIGYFLSSAFVELLGVVTRKASKSKTGWLDGIDMNKNHLELFYWFSAILSLLNFVNYVFRLNGTGMKRMFQLMK